MEIEYSFKDNGIHINFKSSCETKKQEFIIYNALPYLQKEVGIPFIEIQEDKIIIHEQWWQKLKYVLWCYKCDSYVYTKDISEFIKYNDNKFVCNRCLDIKVKQLYSIDSNIFDGLIDKRKSDKGSNKKRRKDD